ncbi:MAG: AI-2E family transporter [Miniphocaeibacter sp.]|uniref:AI-2E family transporter n=1 Tax=Miniphocaeibacter sp. TaxID=3100973 RepID=UPI0017F839BC|nr:AI-2E family transporter [Gallicola sp.]
MPFDVRETLINVIFILLTVLIALGIYYLINIGNTKVSLKNRLRLDQSYIKRVTVYILVILAVLYIFTKFTIIGSTIITMIIALVVAYLINPLVKKLENKGVKRAYAILLVYFLVILLFAIIIILIMPKLSEQLKRLLYTLPSFFEDLFNSAYKFLKENFSENETVQNLITEAKGTFTKSISSLQGKLIAGISNVGERVSGIASGLIRIVLIPIFSFYFLMDKEKYVEGFKKSIPEKHRENIISLLKDIDKVNSQFVRGRLIMAMAVGVLTAIFLFIMRIEYALIVGIITCVADIIPYIGPALGFIPAVLIAFFDSPIKALFVAVVFLLIQWAENNIMAPKILGTTIGLNPMLILLCLIIGAGMFGVPGMIFSVPVVATIKVVINHYKNDVKKFFIKEENEEDNI